MRHFCSPYSLSAIIFLIRRNSARPIVSSFSRFMTSSAHRATKEAVHQVTERLPSGFFLNNYGFIDEGASLLRVPQVALGFFENTQGCQHRAVGRGRVRW